jgi:hypothetical protein
MLIDEEHVPATDERTPQVHPGNYSPVTVYMEDALGTIFLGVLSILLLIGWRCTETRYRRLMARLEMTDGNRSSNTR